MRFLQAALLFSIFVTSVFPQELPKGLTQAEREMMRSYTAPVSLFGFTQPPAVPVRTMAEWEELQGIIITWTSQTTILRQIVDYAQDEGKVYIVCSDSNSVKSSLTSGGVPLTNVEFLIASFNSIWVRDYGPWAVYTNDADSLYLVDWIYNRPRPLDDRVPETFASRYNIPLYQTTVSPYDFVATGGNFMTDGHGTGFSSRLIVTENPNKTEAQIDTIVKRFMGIDRYIKMTVLPYDGIHHIDMHMKLLDDETLMVGQYPAGVSDGPQIEANLQYVLSNFKTAFGRDFKVVRIPMPPDGSGRYPSSGGQYRTYTNSVIVNKTVIVPTYELKYDTTALRIYREAMPGYRVVGINCNSIIGQSGAIHCITKEIGVDEPVYIKLYPLAQTSGTGFEAKAVLKTRTGISNAALYYSSSQAGPYIPASFSGMVQDTFYTTFSVSPGTDTVYYYAEAATVSGRSVKKPLVAPEGVLKHAVDPLLPVELVSFTARESEGSVLLSWVTATELNNKGFEIERRADSGIWQVIGYISGSGNSSERREYTFSDNTPLTGKSYYRLKQTDFSGAHSYSTVAEVLLTGEMQFSLEQNYPNPFNPSTVIQFQIPEAGNVSLKVYDVTGRELRTLINEYMQSGTWQASFDGTGLASGVYFYEIKVNSFIQNRKMILLK
ncbi:MAG: agmatine deiminase family protein [Ignavibacteriales bacterium]|nr:MAG: agmatine deiminase family protein [Ignavibacteriales bacterium]